MERPVKRMNYHCFSQEILQNERTFRKRCKDKIDLLKAERKNYAKGSGEFNKIQADIDQVYKELNDNKERVRKTRADIKHQLRALRKMRKNETYQFPPSEEQLEPVNAWKTRVPNMHTLFPVSNHAARNKIENKIKQISNLSPSEFLDQLIQLIDDEMIKSTPNTHVIGCENLESLIFNFGKDEIVTKILSSILESPKHLKIVCEQSDHHDLFEKLVLLCGPNPERKWKLRMHLFIPNQFTEAQEEVHSHRNHFASRIIIGGFAHEIWETPEFYDNSDDSNQDIVQYHQYLYNPAIIIDDNGKEQRVFNLDEQGTIALKRIRTDEVSRGQTYYMNTSVLHCVKSLAGNTVTIVLNAPQTNPTSCFSTIEPWKDQTFVRSTFTEEQISTIINQVLTWVSNIPNTNEIHQFTRPTK